MKISGYLIKSPRWQENLNEVITNNLPWNVI
jgi:hypothetical protein